MKIIFFIFLLLPIFIAARQSPDRKYEIIVDKKCQEILLQKYTEDQIRIYKKGFPERSKIKNENDLRREMGIYLKDQLGYYPKCRKIIGK